MPKTKLLKPLRLNENVPPEKAEEVKATHAALLWLAKHYPQAFPREARAVHPLKIGIADDLLEAIKTVPDAPEAGILARALQLWTQSPPYLTGAAEGRDRLNLDGSVASPITPEHQAFAQTVLDGRKARGSRTKVVAPPRAPVIPPRVPRRPVIGLKRRTA